MLHQAQMRHARIHAKSDCVTGVVELTRSLKRLVTELIRSTAGMAQDGFVARRLGSYGDSCWINLLAS